MNKCVWMGSVLLALLTGCRAVGPDYERPTEDLASTAVPQVMSGKTISANEAAAWWTVFNHPVLTNLIVRALGNNRTLRGGVARVREARARLGITRAGLLPEVDAGGFYQRYRNSDNVAVPSDNDIYHVGFDASWELDIFGRRRREIEAAQAAFEAETASLEQVWVTLAAETARTYVELQTIRRRLAVARAHLLVQTDTLDLVASRAGAGLSDALAVEQANYNLERTRATIPSLLSAEEAALNALAVLTGARPGSLASELPENAPVLGAAPRMLTGIPADLLRRRPDVRAAERQLAAQTARVGVAEADRYPTFRLTGSVGLESLDADTIFESGSRFFAITPAVTWPLFRGGSIRANIEVQNARQEQALAVYEQAVLEAVQELRDALAAYGHEYARCDALRKAANASREAVALAQNQYANGLTDFNNVLDAQRSQLTFEESLVISESAISAHLIRVYKALGGGWDVWQGACSETAEDPSGRRSGCSCR